MTSLCPLCGGEAVLFARSEKRPFFQCRECGLIHLDSEYRLSAEDEKKRYLLHRNDPNDPEYRTFLNQLIEPLCDFLQEGAQGLDYGCGPGPTVSVMMRERGFEVKNYDPYFYPDEVLLNTRYDFITCTETAEHFYYPQFEFERFDCLLRGGGKLAVMTGIYDESVIFSEWYYPKDPTHVSIYTRETFRWLAEKHGWKVSYPGKNIIFFEKRREMRG